MEPVFVQPPVFEQQYEVPIQPEQFNAIVGLLDAIEKDPNAEEFLEPVDW